MVDEERVTRLASGVLGDVARLRRLAEADLADDVDQLDAVKYRFVTAIEGCVGVAHHIIAAEGWGAPDSNADAFGGLGDNGVIDEELAATMAKASGFRNILVHRYGEVDDGAVVDFLDQLGDLERFVQDVLAWLQGRVDRKQ